MSRNFIISVLLFLPLLALGQAEFFASTDIKDLYASQSFRVEFTAKNADITNFTPPPFSDFKVLSGPHKSNSISIVNGDRSSTLTYSYTLLPKSKGSLHLEAATFEANGKEYKTNSLHFQVKAAKEINTNGKEIFVDIQFSKDKVYVGEQVLMDLVLYTQKPIQNVNLNSSLDLSAFYNVQVFKFPKSAQRVSLNGKEYTKQLIYRYALYPMKSGSIQLGPAFFTAHVITSNSGHSFFRRTQKEQIVAEEKSLEVMPLPDAPVTYSGGIGSFKLQGMSAQSQVSLGEAFEINIRLEGESDPNIVEAPMLNIKGQAEVYEPQLEHESLQDFQGRKRFIKTWKYLVVPEEEGKIEIQPYFVHFNTSKEKYDSLFSNKIEGHVSPANTTSQVGQIIPEEKQGQTKGSFFNLKNFLLLGSVLLILAFLWWKFGLKRNSKAANSGLKSAIQQGDIDKLKEELVLLKEKDTALSDEKIDLWLRKIESFQYSPVKDKEAINHLFAEIKSQVLPVL